MTASLFALRCGGGDESPFSDAGGRAGSSTSGSSGTAGTAAGTGGSAGSTSACAPGVSEACSGENDCAGTKVCLADGAGFSACDCSGAQGGEGGGSAAGGEGGGSAAGGAPGAGGAADAGSAGRAEGGSGAVGEGGRAGASGGGAPGEAGTTFGGGAGVTSGGDSGAGGAAEPVTVKVTDLIDSYVDSCNEDERHGLEDLLLVDRDPCEYQVFIAPAEPLAIPAGAVVEAATLTLVCDNEGADVEVSKVAEAWSETTIAWENRPELGTLQSSFEANEGVVELDLTSLVQSWVDSGTAFGVALTPTGDNGSDYFSTEAADASVRPVLTITYRR